MHSNKCIMKRIKVLNEEYNEILLSNLNMIDIEKMFIPLPINSCAIYIAYQIWENLTVI